MCKAILTGLVNQMNHDDRIGCSFKPEEISTNVGAEDDDEDDVDEMNIEEVNLDVNGGVEDQTITWSRKDYGTTRLMMPGHLGPRWSSCLNRVTRDLDTDMIIEDRPIEEIKGRERRREFKGGPRNIITTFVYRVDLDTKPHQWECRSCQHRGWLKTPVTCDA